MNCKRLISLPPSLSLLHSVPSLSPSLSHLSTPSSLTSPLRPLPLSLSLTLLHSVSPYEHPHHFSFTLLCFWHFVLVWQVWLHFLSDYPNQLKYYCRIAETCFLCTTHIGVTRCESVKLFFKYCSNKLKKLTRLYLNYITHYEWKGVYQKKSRWNVIADSVEEHTLGSLKLVWTTYVTLKW